MQKIITSYLCSFIFLSVVAQDVMTPETLIQLNRVSGIGITKDGNNVVYSLIEAAVQFDFELSIASPKGYEPNQSFVKSYQNNINYCSSPMDACKDADLVVTDVWTSMGKESEQKHRELAFKGYQVDQKMMSVANSDALFMHCLPAHRGEEITDEVMDGTQSIVFDQAENRLHVQNAIMIKLCE